MKKIRLDFKYCERGRFYRTLVVKEDINLVDLGCAIVTAFNGAFEHCFYFKTKDYFYNPKVFMDDSLWNNDLLMDDYTLEDLGERFEFCYDSGEGWDFIAKVYKKTVEPINLDDDVFLIEGAGLGIFEDNIVTMYNYLKGRLDPNSSKEDEMNSLPWNLDMKKYGDFDEAFHLKEEIERFNESYLEDRQRYRDADKSESASEENEETDEEASAQRLHHYLIEAAHEQIKNLDYVGEAYNRLLKTYSEEIAVDKIATVLLQEMYDMEKESRDFDEKHYIEKMSKLN